MIDVVKGKPFTLPDGTTVTPNGNVPGKANEITQELPPIPEMEEALDDPFEEGLTFRRTLADLPSNPKRTNPIMLVLAYSMWGLDSNAIGMLLDLPTEQVEGVMCDDLYVSMRKDILEAIRYAETGTVHGFLSQQSITAARTVVAHMKGKDGDRALSAAKDILDRSGFRPSDRVEHVHKFEDELRIVYMKEQVSPTINLDMNGIANGNSS